MSTFAADLATDDSKLLSCEAAGAYLQNFRFGKGLGLNPRFCLPSGVQPLGLRGEFRKAPNTPGPHSP